MPGDLNELLEETQRLKDELVRLTSRLGLFSELLEDRVGVLHEANQGEARDE